MSAPFIIAVPSKGRLHENAVTFFARAGLELVKPRGERDYRGTITDLPGIEVAYLSSSEIADLLAQGAVHIGLTGEDLIREVIPNADDRVVFVEKLGFGHANVVVAVPQAWIDVQGMADLDDVATAFRLKHHRKMRLATKYMNLTRNFFSAHGVTDYRIVESSGATEAAPAAGTAELIVDITTTGATLAANGLKVIDDGVILRSQANLVAARVGQLGRDGTRHRRYFARPHRRTGAGTGVPRGAHALYRLRRRIGRRSARAVRRGGTVRRADLLGHAHAALPARARACTRHFPARQGRRERRGRGPRLCILAQQSALRPTRSGAWLMTQPQTAAVARRRIKTGRFTSP